MERQMYTNTQVNGLESLANKIRNITLDMCLQSGGHIASSFSCVEIFVALYFGGILTIDPNNPDFDGRDRFILSKGHGETVFYAVLAERGFFPKELIQTSYRSGDCFLGGHPDKSIPGVEVTTGALGHGLGIACGLSVAAKMDNKKHLQYVLMGDGECSEGSVWEAAMFAGKHLLNNLITIVDRNRIGSIDFTENYACLDPFTDKWQAFGWDVSTCNGHDFNELASVINNAKMSTNGMPHLIIANTVKGKGISFIENDPIWHARSISGDEEIRIAKQELRRT
jgi:transketolase